MLELIALTVFLLINLAFALVLLVLFIYMLSSLFVWPPSVPTDSKTRKIMLNSVQKYLPQHASQNAELKIADLGSGYGQLVSAAAKKYPKSSIVGFEILYLPYYFSKLIFHYRKNIKIEKANLFEVDISNFDTIITFYHSIKKETRLAEKILKECKKDCLIITNNYQLDGVKLLEKIDVKLLLGKRYVYVYQV